MRGARGGLASHSVATAVLSGAALGHDRVRDGSGWGQRALGHGHPASSDTLKKHMRRMTAVTGITAPTTKSRPSHTHTPLTIRTSRLQSVARGPPLAYQPARLAGVSRTLLPWDVSSRGKIPA